MRIFIISGEEYGAKIVNGIANHGFASNIVGIHEFSSHGDLPDFIDDVSEYVPEKIPKADLLIATGIHGDINLTIPEIVEKSGIKSVIAPINHPKQIPLGLQSEIKDLLLDNVKIIFPKPFCSLLPIGDKYIDKFAEKFGKPELNIGFNDKINSVEVIRGAPCGSTWFIAENLKGIPIDEAEFVTANKFHNFPCSASMATDPLIKDAILHLAGYKAREATKRALGFTNKSVMVDVETCEGLEECDNICIDSCPNVLTGDHTIYYDKNGKARIDPGSCGVCEICIKECPYGSIEVYEERIQVHKVPEWDESNL
jgi:NAD-dependent dihydropyrimidine dehydrogenase PreA subunit